MLLDNGIEQDCDPYLLNQAVIEVSVLKKENLLHYCVCRSLCLSAGQFAFSIFSFFFFQFILTSNYLSLLFKKTSRLLSPESRGVSQVLRDFVYSLQAFDCLFVLETPSKLTTSSWKCDTNCSYFDHVTELLSFQNERIKTQTSNNRKQKIN